MDPSDGDTFKILISSDNHLGVYDTNPCRENDSFVTFEEILQIGKDQHVDFVLLGGDLFHENKPTPASFQRTVDLLQKYCLGPRPVQFEYLGDPKLDFHGQKEPCVNYYNSNVNIDLPIFTIHGNHDDPIGLKKTSVIDHLAAANLVNHFGTVKDLKQIDIRPVLLRKGLTFLAIYGLGNVKDQRLFRLMKEGKVQFLRPAEDAEKWYSIFVIHQNRAKHGVTNYIPENFIPAFIDLVIWGHEHECKPILDQLKNTTESDTKCTMVVQPGSSVATQLQPGEAELKHTLILSVCKKQFKLTKIPLKTVRPFIITNVLSSDIIKSKGKSATVEKTVELYLEARLKSLVNEANDFLTGDDSQPIVPLIRIRLFHSDDIGTFHAIRFNQKFLNTVANEDIVTVTKLPSKTGDPAEVMNLDDIQEFMMEQDEVLDLGAHVEEIVEQYFRDERAKSDRGNFLLVLSDRGISEAVRAAAEKDDQGAIGLIVDAQIEKTMKHLEVKRVNEDNIGNEIMAFRDSRFANIDREIEEEDITLQVGNRLKVYKLINYEPDSNELAVEEVIDDDDVTVEDHLHNTSTLGTTGDGSTVIQLRPNSPGTTGGNVTKHVVLLRTGSDSVDVNTDDSSTVTFLDNTVPTTTYDLDTFDDTSASGTVTVDGETLWQPIVLGEDGSTEQFILYYEGSGEPVQVTLDNLDPLLRQTLLYENAVGTDLEEPGTVTDPSVVMPTGSDHDVRPKVKELSTAAALDLGCEWSTSLPFGFQGQSLDTQCQKVILNVWHYFKNLKKYPELLGDKNAQGLAGDALNIGTKTIGRIGKRFRRGKAFRVLSPSKSTRQQLQQRAQNPKKATRGRGSTNADASYDSDEPEQMDEGSEPEVEEVGDSDEGPSTSSRNGRGRGGGRARGSRRSSGSPAAAAAAPRRRGRGSTGGGRGRGKTAAVTLPVKVKNRGHGASVVFDDDE